MALDFDKMRVGKTTYMTAPDELRRSSLKQPSRVINRSTIDWSDTGGEKLKEELKRPIPTEDTSMKIDMAPMQIPMEEEEPESTFDDGGEHQQNVQKELEESFSLFDINGDGRISLNELLSAMVSVGKECTIDDAQEIMEIFDLDGDGELNFEEFKQAMHEKFSEGVVEEDLLEAFHVFDMDRDGFITPGEIITLFSKLGEMITEEEAMEIMRDCDADDDGLIDFNEFKDFYKRMTNPPPEESEEKDKGKDKSGS